MEFEHNYIPKDLRPIKTVTEEPRIAMVSATTVEPEAAKNRNPECLANIDGSIPVYYPANVYDGGCIGLGYGNPSPIGVAAWAPRLPMSVGSVNVGMKSSAVGFGYSPNSGNRMVSNAIDHSGNEMMVKLANIPHPANQANGNGSNENTPTVLNYSPNSGGTRGSGSGADYGSEEGGDDSASGKKVKFLCSFGGKILPRPSDGMLRYVGGQTRIISVKRDVSFNELMQKMTDSYGQPAVTKYQLPNEDIDALVSVSCADDLDNMMDEYEKLVERSNDGSAKLRVFLFSATELDSPGVVQSGDLHDNGLRYVDAVNGIMDGFINGISRKESIASATSTQNSDSGNEVVDSFVATQMDVNGAQQINILSNLGNTHDANPKLVPMEHNPLGIPMVNSGSPQTLSSPQSDVEFERSVPVALTQQQLGYDYQQAMMGISPHSPPLQAYVDPNGADYRHQPSHMRFPNAQFLGTAGSAFTQQQFRDNNVGVAPHRFVSTVHMAMAPTSHVSIRPSVQPLVQCQQTRMEHYSDENTFGKRFVQLPIDPTYNAYQAQYPSQVIGGGYAWHPVPQAEHAIYSDGSVSPQQMAFPEKIQRFEDCIMCQKALPHAHSDPLVQNQKESGLCAIPDSHSIHQSLLNRGMVAGALGDVPIEQGTGFRSPAFSHTDHQVGLQQPEAVMFYQNPTLHDNMRTTVRMTDNSDQSKISVPRGMMGVPGLSTMTPQSRLEDSLHQYLVPRQYQRNEEALQNKRINTDIPYYTGVIQASEHLGHESPVEFSCRLPGVVSKDQGVESCISSGQRSPIEGMMESLWISPPEINANNEQYQSLVDKMRKDEILDIRGQQTLERNVILDATYNNPQVSRYQSSAVLPASVEVSYAYNSQQMETYEATQPPVLGNQGSYPQSQIGVHLLDNDNTSYGTTAFSGTDPSYVVDRTLPVQWGNGVLQLQPTVGYAEIETTSNPNSSFSSSVGVEDVHDSSNSFFSNQDPWNLRHDTHVPPKPNKILTRIEDFDATDPFSRNNSSNGGESITNGLLMDIVSKHLSNTKDFNSEQVESSQGSAEELVKQELRVVPEDVVASVFSLATPDDDSMMHEQKESTSEESKDDKISSKDIEIKQKPKFEDVISKVPERVNFGFPMSGGIGRLQIIKNGDLEELQELGSGTFGTVYHGKWRGTDVAIKRINGRCFAGKPTEQERMIDDFWNEAAKLAELHHPNVVAFYGMVLDGPGGSVATVTEFMVNGSLRNALQKNERSIDKRKRLLVAMDVAFGMEYLHGKNIVHFDLKSDNLLVNLRDPHRPICKVGDLGLSKVKCQTLISGGVRGTLPWMAPELLNGSSSLVSEKVDVFSFGIVLWELLTGEEPYADLHYGAIIGGIVSNTLRPAVPESCDPEWRTLMERCWSSDPLERPSFPVIANELRAMATKTPTKGKNSPQAQVQN
ncbi:RAF-like serine/threonine-protein kinase PRAF [Euphorbia lathyris]|uniref:RAF-like serine/threonine-protein kinase PRAF n=1 Tax=Euphorbia lathyris TaxID=212925 RepID=UPI0033137C9A